MSDEVLAKQEKVSDYMEEGRKARLEYEKAVRNAGNLSMCNIANNCVHTCKKQCEHGNMHHGNGKTKM